MNYWKQVNLKDIISFGNGKKRPAGNGSIYEFYDNNGLCAPVGWDISCLSNMADYLNGLAMQKDWPSFVTHCFQS